MIAQKGSWLISFNHSIEDTKNRRWIKAIETHITSPIWNFIQASPTNGFTNKRKSPRIDT